MPIDCRKQSLASKGKGVLEGENCFGSARNKAIFADYRLPKDRLAFTQ